MFYLKLRLKKANQWTKAALLGIVLQLKLGKVLLSRCICKRLFLILYLCLCFLVGQDFG